MRSYLKASRMNTHPNKPCVAQEPPSTVETEFGELPIGVFDPATLSKEHLQTMVRWFAYLEQKEAQACPTVNL